MTARSLAWDGLVIGGTFAFIYGSISLTLACIGTHDRDEVRPVLAVMSWWRAHRLPLLGLLFPERGRRASGDGWHPLDDDEEADDGAAAERLADHHDERAAGRLTHAGEDDEEAGDEEADPLEGVPGRHAREVRGRPGGSADDVPVPVPSEEPASATGQEADDDLSGLSAEDTDTLRAIRALNAEHLVPTNEPDPPGPADPDWQCPACDRWFTNHDPRHDLCVYCRSRSPEDHPGPAPGMDVDTSSGPGPGDLICDECNYPLHPCPRCDDAIGHDGYDDHQCAQGDDLVADGFGGWLSPECAAGRHGECSYRDCADPNHEDDEPIDSAGPGDHPPARQPGAQTAARRPFGRLPAAALAMVRRDGPARFWTAATMSECAQTAALLALADSILAGGAA